MLGKGTFAPAFSLPDQDQKQHALADYVGEWVLLYFYPKDDTPGCTKEACTIAEVYDDFKRYDVNVVGVSKDSPQSHKKFAKKYDLPFTLLSDESTEMIQVYGAWNEKSNFGKKHFGISRVSYLIAPDGTIAAVYPKVDPANHAAQLLLDIKALQTA